MTDPIEQDEIEEVSADASFGLLGNEIRLDIIQALGETPDESVSFSALRNRIDVADSGQFNYHLMALVGSFVRHNDDDDEYELTYAGRRVIGAIFSGTYTQRGIHRSFELDSTCFVCGSPLLAEYEHERVTIRCQPCEDRISTFGFPPGAFENRTREEFIRVLDRWIQSYVLCLASGFCPNCAGRIHGSLTDNSEYLEEEQDVLIEHLCERCNEHSTSSVGAYLIHHPAVIGFHYDHDIDLNETPFWELSWLRDRETTVLSREPWRVQSIVELDGDQLQCVIEDDLSISIE